MKILCLIGIHNWEITSWGIFNTKKQRSPTEQGFNRECKWCGKEQCLLKPKKYHPTKYVWTNLTPPKEQKQQLKTKQ